MVMKLAVTLLGRTGFEHLRVGLRSVRADLTRLAVILAVIATLCGPGIVAKITGLLRLGIAGADPAISVGTVIRQTAPLTLAIAVVMLFLPFSWRGLIARTPDIPLPFVLFGGATFCVLVIAMTTYVSNASGLASGVSLRRAWDASRGGGQHAPEQALLSFGSQYLHAYGYSAFLSAFVVAYFLARWYRRLTVPASSRNEPDVVAVHPTGWVMSSFADGRLVALENVQHDIEPRYLENIDPDQHDAMFKAFTGGDLSSIEALPWKSVPGPSSIRRRLGHRPPS
jgi:hypothetical protein